MKICYQASRYRSHWRVAQDYCSLIKTEHLLTNQIEQADVVILHHEPDAYDSIYASHPELKSKYVVGYCVWEATELPALYRFAIACLQEIWTCSRYCYDVFAKYHRNVVYIPHIVERSVNFSVEDQNKIRRAIRYEEGCIYYLFITKSWDKRKNTGTLLRAFANQSRAMPRARLVIKTTPGKLPDSILPDPRITYLPADCTDAQINALYEMADVYASAHHSEGWGLTLSDAMIFGKPVIATEYSGNLEFMSQANSILVKSVEAPIRPEDCFLLFHSGMRWAYPEPEDLERNLLLVYDTIHSDAIAAKVKLASEDTARFSKATVGAILHKRLHELTGLLNL
jgi:glycosyltransferase involved in cell wall biosynthesis